MMAQSERLVMAADSRRIVMDSGSGSKGGSFDLFNAALDSTSTDAGIQRLAEL